MCPAKNFVPSKDFFTPPKHNALAPGLLHGIKSFVDWIPEQRDGVITRGGVEDIRLEDIRLEAKAKDTKKSEATRTAFPRTDTLEAKDRNARGQGQGHKRKCSPKKKKKVITKIFQAVSKKKIKKKGLHINFSGNLHKKPFPKNFSTAPQNFNNSKNTAVLEPRTGQFSRT